MKERLKVLRKKLGLTQGEFASKISTSQGSYAMLEIGSREISDKTIRVICYVFNVNEAWLRTGEGGEDNIFVKDEAVERNIVDELTERYNLSETGKAIIETYLEMNDIQRSIVDDWIKNIAKKTAPAEAQSQKLRTAKMIARSPDSDGKPHLITDEETLSRLESAPESDDDL